LLVFLLLLLLAAYSTRGTPHCVQPGHTTLLLLCLYCPLLSTVLHLPSTVLQAVQDLYEECQATFDPNHIAALLHSHPYHLDALLTMHDLYRSTGEQAYAGG
jgi:hypothetical protein